jgi:two-component system, cell cycle response regulator DivK
MSTAEPAATRREVVLLVEDDPEIRDVFAVYLRSCGFTVHEASDGHDGVARARQLEPDVIVMDLAMPGLTGWEATRQIRDDAPIARVPVIAVTAYGGTGFEWLAAEAGCNSLLTKPVRPGRLLEEIENVLTKSAGRD